MLLLNQLFLICLDDICKTMCHRTDTLMFICSAAWLNIYFQIYFHPLQMSFPALLQFSFFAFKQFESQFAANISHFIKEGNKKMLARSQFAIEFDSTQSVPKQPISFLLWVFIQTLLIQETAATDQSYCLEGTRKLNLSDTASYLIMDCGFGWIQISVRWISYRCLLMVTEGIR